MVSARPDGVVAALSKYRYHLAAAAVALALLWYLGYLPWGRPAPTAPAPTAGAYPRVSWAPTAAATAAATARPEPRTPFAAPAFAAPVDAAQAITPGIREAAFDDVAATLLSGSGVLDERIQPTLSAKNGGLLPNLDVRGDYDAMQCVDEERADDCGCWNRSSAQRGIRLGYIKETDRRRVVLAGP
jgi:hypothetical protein